MSKKNAIKEFFQDQEFIEGFTRKIITPAIEQAVAAALAQRDEKIIALENELTRVKDELSAVKLRLDATETQSRQNYLTISGVPERQGEKTDQLVVDVAKAAGLNISANDLDRSHRIGTSSSDRHRLIVAKFVSNKRRQELFEARKSMSAHRIRDHPILSREVMENVYLSEFLTPKAQHLIFVARQLKRKGKIAAAYSTNGNVRIRITENEAAKTIREISDLQRLLDNDTQLQDILDAIERQTRRHVVRPRGGAEATPGTPARSQGPPAPPTRPDARTRGAGVITTEADLTAADRD